MAGTRPNGELGKVSLSPTRKCTHTLTSHMHLHTHLHTHTWCPPTRTSLAAVTGYAQLLVPRICTTPPPPPTHTSHTSRVHTLGLVHKGCTMYVCTLACGDITFFQLIVAPSQIPNHLIQTHVTVKVLQKTNALHNKNEPDCTVNLEQLWTVWRD